MHRRDDLDPSNHDAHELGGKSRSGKTASVHWRGTRKKSAGGALEVGDLPRVEERRDLVGKEPIGLERRAHDVAGLPRFSGE